MNLPVGVQKVSPGKDAKEDKTHAHPTLAKPVEHVDDKASTFNAYAHLSEKEKCANRKEETFAAETHARMEAPAKRVRTDLPFSAFVDQAIEETSAKWWQTLVALTHVLTVVFASVLNPVTGAVVQILDTGDIVRSPLSVSTSYRS